jgi:hypothetical protein
LKWPSHAPLLSDDFFDHTARLDAGQTAIKPLKFDAEALVVDAELM